MTPRIALPLAALVLVVPATLPAQPVPDAAALPASAAARQDQSLQRRIIEDQGVRIEETRLRGAATHITVHSKLPGVKPYQIQVAPAGRDRSEPRGGAGQRAWTLFDF